MDQSFKPHTQKVFFFLLFSFRFWTFNFFRGLWSKYEDLNLLEKYIKFNNKWSIIAESLKGRNLNSVKNRFNSLLKKFMVMKPSKENIEQLMERIKNSEIEEKTKNLSVQPKEIINIEDSPKNKIKAEDPHDYTPPINPIFFKQIPQPYPIFNPFGQQPMDYFGDPFGRFNGFMNGFMPQFPTENPFLMYDQLRSKCF